MTINLVKCACSTNDNQEMKTEDVQIKYLLGTYNQEEAIQLLRKYSMTIVGQDTKTTSRSL